MSPQRPVIQLVGGGRIERIRATLQSHDLGIEVRWANDLSGALDKGTPDAPPAVLVLEEAPTPESAARLASFPGAEIPPLLAAVIPDDADPLPSYEKGADLVLREGFDARIVQAQLLGLLRLFGRLRAYERQLRQQVRFLGAVAHDLRSPTTAILGYAEFLREAIEPGREDLAGDLAHVIENATAIQDLTAEISAVASETTNDAPVALDTIDLHVLVGQAIDALRPTADAKRIQLQFDRGSAPARVLGQRGQLRRVFVNLLENALKFTPEGGHVSASISCGGDRIQVAIDDDGPGIPREARETVFRRRFRLRQVHGEGKGLGLAIAREITDLHAGTIRVEDGPSGRGSRFVVELPALSGPRAERIESPNGAVEIAHLADGIAISFEGTIAAEDVARIQNRLRAAVAGCREAVTIDLARVDALSSRGAALLIELKLEAEMRGIPFRLDEISPDVEEALARSRLLELFGMSRSPS